VAEHGGGSDAPGSRATDRMAESRKAGISGAEFAGIGIQFAATILVFVFAGIWLDKRFGTSPWLLILFVFVGASAGFFSMYRKVTAAQRREARDRS
jgi:F0F1-type ATP synthase assembly protein I